MYFVINDLVVARLTIAGVLEITGTLSESQTLAASPSNPKGLNSSGKIYISLNTNVTLMTIDEYGNVELAGTLTPDQTLSFSGNQWEIESDATTGWLNVGGYRVGDFDVTGNLELAGSVVSPVPVITLPVVLTLSHDLYADYEFPGDSDSAFWINGLTNKWRRKSVARIAAHGANDAADGFLKERTISVEGILRADTEAEYRTKKDALVRACSREGSRLWVDYERYYPLDGPAKLTENWLAGYFMRGANITIQWLQTQPFALSSDLITGTVDVTTDPQTFYIDASDSVEEVYPMFRVTAIDNITSLKVKNVSDSNREWEYTDAAFVTGTNVEVDGVVGTVVHSVQGNRIVFFDGPWIRLLPGVNNELEISGGDCTLYYEYRNHYL
jgi:hypothetical protein